MKLHSLYKSRIENLGIRISPADFKKIIDSEEREFHFKWVTQDSFVISLNFSLGSNLLFDVHRPNTKSDIIIYGKLIELEESKTKIRLKTRRKGSFAILSIVFPLLILGLQIMINMELAVFLLALIFFPLMIIGLLNIIQNEENKLLRHFKEHLNSQILTRYSTVKNNV